MGFETLTLKSIRARPVVLKLRRPVAARIATLTDWPLILIDLYTEEGVIGRAYLEPYVPKSMRYLIPALHDLGEMLKGRPSLRSNFTKRPANHCILLATRAWQ
jgi:mandelate racemase